ncbi:hypothetical protein EAE89_05580 [Photorhabdus heterorhabditis]|nr:hypothetical protein [Photorhabdus heterorhabditis]
MDYLNETYNLNHGIVIIGFRSANYINGAYPAQASLARQKVSDDTAKKLKSSMAERKDGSCQSCIAAVSI